MPLLVVLPQYSLDLNSGSKKWHLATRGAIKGQVIGRDGKKTLLLLLLLVQLVRLVWLVFVPLLVLVLLVQIQHTLKHSCFGLIWHVL